MFAKLKNIIDCLNKYYNIKTQENWDNSGLACGDVNQFISSIILCLDVTDEIIDNAEKTGSELIISHHPILFSPLYSLAESGCKEKLLIRAIKNNIAIYCLHTPADKAQCGINYATAEKLGLKKILPVSSKDNLLYKIHFICNQDNLNIISEFLKEHGCFDTLIIEDISHRLSVSASITNINLQSCIKNIKHQFDIDNVIIYPTNNVGNDLCNFVIGQTDEISADDFIENVKKALGLEKISIGGYLYNKIKKVAVCGGAGRSFINDILSYKADAYITGDLSHHDYQKAYENKLMLIDATHYASEKVFMEIIKKTLISENIGFCNEDIKCVDQQGFFNKIL